MTAFYHFEKKITVPQRFNIRFFVHRTSGCCRSEFLRQPLITSLLRVAGRTMSLTVTASRPQLLTRAIRAFLKTYFGVLVWVQRTNMLNSAKLAMWLTPLNFQEWYYIHECFSSLLSAGECFYRLLSTIRWVFSRVTPKQSISCLKFSSDEVTKKCSYWYC